MLDPIPCPQFWHDLVYPSAQFLHLTTLPNHVHEVILSFTFYTLFQNYLSPALSRRLYPQHYDNFPQRTKINWDIHLTAFVQSIIICSATLYVIMNDADRIGKTWEDRMYGYSGAAGMVQGLAAGYFLWDFMVSLINIQILGPLDLIHSVIAGGVAVLGFRPFCLYYGLKYLLFELSTPFVNIHWFCDKVDLTGSTTQWLNGIVLLISFFSCRLLWGSYLTYHFFEDVWTATQADQAQISISHWTTKTGGEVTTQNKLPLWMLGIFCVGNLALTSLNIFWFSKMIDAVRKRFSPEAGGTKVNGAIPKGVSRKTKVW